MKDIKSKLHKLVSNGYSSDSVTIYGEHYDFHELCEEHGIEVPKGKKAKKQVNKNKDIQEEEHADMEEQDHSGDTEES